MQPKEISIRIEPQAAGKPLTGTVGEGADGHGSFRGWLGLIAAIERLLQPRTGAAGPDRTREEEKR